MYVKGINWDFQNIPYGPDNSQRFDMICGKKLSNSSNVHAIVYIHGGAYFKGSRFEYPSFLADFSENNLFATMDYRIINADNEIHLGDILNDVNSVLLKIIELSKEKGVNIKDFILVGHSAGGHIALLYAYKNFRQNEKIKITACVSMAGPTDFTDDSGWSSMKMWGEDMETRLSFLSWMGTRLTNYQKLTGDPMTLTQFNWTKQNNYSKYKKYIEDISPVTYVYETLRKPASQNFPATLLIHARGDDQVPYSNPVRLMKLLDETSAPHKLITPEGIANDHMLGGVVFADNTPFVFKNQAWVGEAMKWIEQLSINN